MPATETAVARISKILAVAVGSYAIGCDHQGDAALNCAKLIAERAGVDIEPLAMRAGIIIPRKPVPREIETGAFQGQHYNLVRTVSADQNMEICTIIKAGGVGRTECYMDEDNSGIRSFLGYADELCADVWYQFESLLRIHWRTFDRAYSV